ncbi:hypothetical protein A0H76_1792 [Hepatospora eriocheir]|uniref:RRM domain-containing protein n=1 Tax=Hepatospora eriocheir TaxID=1081669 RepID=A0A1X0QKP1_9MICR|nr:hypothetical protein A0H76_1792 [Hepatospora eriocheir]
MFVNKEDNSNELSDSVKSNESLQKYNYDEKNLCEEKNLKKIKKITFKEEPEIKLIPLVKKIEKEDFKINNLVITLSNTNKMKIKNAKNYKSMIIKDNKVIDLRYNTKLELEQDLHLMKLKNERVYQENKYKIDYLSYKTTEESLRKLFSKYGNIKSINIDRNKSGYCRGSAVITFYSNINLKNSMHFEGKNIKVSKLKIFDKKPVKITIKGINKNIKISDLRVFVKDFNVKSKNISLKNNSHSEKKIATIFFKNSKDAQYFNDNFYRISKKSNVLLGNNVNLVFK